MYARNETAIFNIAQTCVAFGKHNKISCNVDPGLWSPIINPVSFNRFTVFFFPSKSYCNKQLVYLVKTLHLILFH